jgi:hypothetical protein
MSNLVIGATVRVIKDLEQEEPSTVGKVGVLRVINEHHEDGDFYGVKLQGYGTILYFWAEELEVTAWPGGVE